MFAVEQGCTAQSTYNCASMVPGECSQLDSDTLQRKFVIVTEHGNGRYRFDAFNDPECKDPVRVSSDIVIGGELELEKCNSVSLQAGGAALLLVSVYPDCEVVRCDSRYCPLRCAGTQTCESVGAQTETTCKSIAACAWDEHLGLCREEQRPFPCLYYASADQCGGHCTWDHYLGVCTETDNACGCTQDGVSNGVPVGGLTGCRPTTDFDESLPEALAAASKICYINSNQSRCGCVFESTQFQGAYFRSCTVLEACHDCNAVDFTLNRVDGVATSFRELYYGRFNRIQDLLDYRGELSHSCYAAAMWLRADQQTALVHFADGPSNYQGLVMVPRAKFALLGRYLRNDGVFAADLVELDLLYPQPIACLTSIDDLVWRESGLRPLQQVRDVKLRCALGACPRAQLGIAVQANNSLLLQPPQLSELPMYQWATAYQVSCASADARCPHVVTKAVGQGLPPQGTVFELDGAFPALAYDCSVSSTAAGDERCSVTLSPPVQLATAVLPPNPPNVSVELTSPSPGLVDLLVSWTAPAPCFVGIAPSEMRLQLERVVTEAEDAGEQAQHAVAPAVPRAHLLANLTAFSSYQLTVVAVNEWGASQAVFETFDTPPTAPSSPPQDIIFRTSEVDGNQTARRLTLTWQAPPQSQSHGVVLRFFVFVMALPGDVDGAIFARNRNNYDRDMENLQPHVVPAHQSVRRRRQRREEEEQPDGEMVETWSTEILASATYAVSIAAVTSAGAGPRSAPMAVQLGAGASQEQDTAGEDTWLPVVGSLAGLLLVVIVLVLILRRRSRRRQLNLVQYPELLLAQFKLHAQRELARQFKYGLRRGGGGGV